MAFKLHYSILIPRQKYQKKSQLFKLAFLANHFDLVVVRILSNTTWLSHYSIVRECALYMRASCTHRNEA